MVDELSLVALSLSHCLALQVVKEAKLARGSAPLAMFLLALSILFSHLSPSPRSLLPLALAGLTTLCVNGSQSNHVVLEAVVALAVVLTAPGPSCSPLRLRKACGSEENLSREKEEQRSEWSSRLTIAMRAILCVLYGMTGFAKLNDAWHDPRHSCCVHMFVAFVANLFDVYLPPSLLRFLPYAATAFELGFAMTLLLLPALPSRWRRRILRTLAILGAGFHVTIALPPPPASVYPFSMLMVPIYVIGLLPDEMRWAARSVSQWDRRACCLLAAVLSSATAICMGLSRRSTHFEYPAYFSWELGLLWLVCAFGGIVAVALLAPPELQSLSAASASHSKPRLMLALAPAALIFAICSATYLGLRTYPSFAMFSNLLIEGGASNHWIVRHPVQWAALTPSEYSPHHAIQILETDLASLRDLQINLAPLLPPHVLRAFRFANVSAEFYITPPAWKYPATETFRPFSVPVVEVRRRLSEAARSGQDVYVRYAYMNVSRAIESKNVYEYVRRGGLLLPGSDVSLEKPIPMLRDLLHRYRTFDLSYSPCRH
ncbi:MAG: hypothetical protein SGPRY_002774 [Prymnesium sp.]